MNILVKTALALLITVIFASCSLFEKSEISKEDEAALRAELGMEYMKIRQYDKAIKEWREAMKLLPDKYYYLANNIGIIYFQEGKLDQAEQEWLHVQKQEPDNSLALINLGNLYQKKGDLDRAETHYKKVIEAEPEYYLSYTNLGSMYMRSGRLNEAVDQLKISLAKNPADPLSKFLLGSIYRRMGEPKIAITYLEEIRKNQPKNPDVLFEIALAHDQMEGYKTAIQYLKQAKAEKPDNPLINNALGYAYAKLEENLDEAESLILKAIDSNPEEISQKMNFRDSLSWLYFQKENYEKAYEEIQGALQMAPESNDRFNPLLSEMNYHLGMISYKLEEKEEARKAFQRSIQLDPGNLYAEKSESAIQELNL